jgi:hypothetical protein
MLAERVTQYIREIEMLFDEVLDELERELDTLVQSSS